METRVFKIKELVENETVILKYIETQRQVADILTKSLGKVAFERLRDDMTGYLAVKHPGNNIHVKSIAVLHALHVGNVQYRQSITHPVACPRLIVCVRSYYRVKPGQLRVNE